MKVCIYNFNGVLDDLVIEISERGDLVTDWKEADVVVLWQDVLGGFEKIAQEAKDAGKRVLVAEHGLLSINDYIPPLSRPLVGDKFMAWGNWTKEWMVEKAKISPNRVVVTGALVSKHKLRRQPHEGKRVLFAPRHWDRELNENIAIANELKKCKYSVFSKIILGEHDPIYYPNPLSTDRQGLNHIDTCFHVLSWADVVVGVGEGTFGALTHLMDIPYISVDLWEDKELLGKTYTKKEFNSQISKACLQVPLEMLNEQIDMVINDPSIGKRNRKWFRKEALSYPGNALGKMLKLIYED